MKKLKVIMIDAFKPSYLKYAPYLKSLTEKYQHGDLDMGIGHWRGVEILFSGKSNTIAVFYKNRNSLKFIKHLLWLENFGKIGIFIVEILVNLPRLIMGYELVRTTNIPLNILYKFDISVKKHVAKKHHFTYFDDLDKLGHKYGTESEQIKNAIKKIDQKISKISFDLIFSDHGMADVKRVISVPITENCFIDSDMARYWGNKNELADIKKKLPLEYGKIIEWNKEYGDLIFLANTESLIFPNFWNKNPVNAMHGYDGKDKEMKAFYLLKKKGTRRDLRAEELHDELNNY